MALPVTVRGGLYNPANSVPMTRAEAYVSPYIRAGWENWKLSLAEAQASAESEDSAYKSRLAYYKLLTEAKSDLQAQLARLQETSYKNGADVDKENFSAETKMAIENADADNTAKRTTVEQAGLSDRAELNADVAIFGTKSRLEGDRLLADAQKYNSASNLNPDSERDMKAASDGYLPNVPGNYRATLLAYKTAAMNRPGAQIEDVRKEMDALSRTLDAKTNDPATLSAAKDAVAMDAVLAQDLQSGALGNKKSQPPGSTAPPPAPGTSLPTRSYTATHVTAPEPLVAKPADTSDLEAKLAALDAKLKAIDVSAPERKSLIEEARAVYAKNFRGFPGATKAPTPVSTPVVDRLQSTKIEAAKKAKQLYDAYSLDITDPANATEKDRVFKAYDPSMIAEIDKLVTMATPKTEKGVIEKQIQAKYEGAGKLSDAMAYYLFKKKTTNPPVVAPISIPAPRIPGQVEAM